jgi:1-aminocyclopropane-1-carboxylate deaminase
VQELDDERVRRAGVRLLLKRDDLLHPPVSGTKWRKLRPNLERARREGRDTLLTFGGAYSNHLRATAAAGREAGLRTVGIVRGEELRERELNPVLAQAVADGMELEFISRARWRTRMEPDVLDAFRRRHGGRAWVVPEGGSNADGVRGCVTLGEELRDCGAQVVCCSVGTGGMLAGLAAGLAPGQRALGFAALAHADLAAETRALQQGAFGGPRGEWTVEDTAVLSGYGRRTPELDAFRSDFEARHGIALDPTYEAKLLFALFARLEEGAWAPVLAGGSLARGGGIAEGTAGVTVAVVIAG